VDPELADRLRRHLGSRGIPVDQRIDTVAELQATVDAWH
jgi:hypothetical protein